MDTGRNKKFEGKRPAYVREADKRVGIHFSAGRKRSVNSNGDLSKDQYIRFMEKGMSDEHILARERLGMAKKRWKIN
ncbi:hypothetical protein BA724_01510 [Domibacillus iocasae]|uniref:Uncharacterized protein n=1 Tax=Domibacillus iocasae TaxID=1714016 RepID=A0A1E7DR36_9BACI|nr:hypothetical protein BA724_01510 [Domibacillus iocasae]